MGSKQQSLVPYQFQYPNYQLSMLLGLCQALWTTTTQFYCIASIVMGKASLSCGSYAAATDNKECIYFMACVYAVYSSRASTMLQCAVS